MLKLFTDTDTDITPAIAAEYGYSLISMPYSVDAKTVYPYVDFDEFEPRPFYDMLRSGVLPTTSAISKERYIEYFEPEMAAGNDILYVHFSRAMTITFDAMDQAVAELRAKYPQCRFEEIDTKGITTISYAVVRAVGDLIKAGKSLDEVLEWAKTEVDHYAMYFYADDLKFFRRSGRVSFYVGHTDAPELAKDLGEALKARFGQDLNIEYVVCNPTAGSHAGPNGVAVCFHAKHR